jgi:hypothetical protein
MDVRCACGAFGHIDDSFFYFYECYACRRKYAVGQCVTLFEITTPELAAYGSGFKTDPEAAQ